MAWMSINDWKRRNGIGKFAKRKATNSPEPPAVSKKYRLLGYDTFSDEWYGLGEYPTEDAARREGIKKLEELAISQPKETSGGQSGIQDQVWIEPPNSRRYRVIG